MRRLGLAICVTVGCAGASARADDLTGALAPVLNACTMPDLTHAERVAAFGPDARVLEGDEKLASLKPMVLGSDLWIIANELLASNQTNGMGQIAARLATLDDDTKKSADLKAEGYLKGSDVLALQGDLQAWVVTSGGTKSARTTCYLSLPEATTVADLEVILKPAYKSYPFDFGQYVAFNISATAAPFLVEAIFQNPALTDQTGLPARVFLQTDDVKSKL
jgi:hypothetical protein